LTLETKPYRPGVLSMLALIQRVTHASVRVEEDIIGQIGPGLAR